MRVLDPTGGKPDAGVVSLSRSGQKPGSRVARLGIIENGNANAEFLLRRLGETVVSRPGWDSNIQWVHKVSAGTGVTDEDLTRLVTACDLVLAGTAD
jgi:hypothetical protein